MATKKSLTVKDLTADEQDALLENADADGIPDNFTRALSTESKIERGIMKDIIIAGILLILLFGCATHGNEQIRDQERVSKILPGITTKAEVTELVGKPTEVTFSDDGDETWKYILSKAQMRASSLIPVVGLFTGGADTQTYTLTVRFKDDIVKSVGKGEMTGGGGSLLDK